MRTKRSVATLVALTTLVACGGDSSVELDTAALRTRIEAAAERVDYDDSENSVAYGDLDGCPVDDYGRLLTSIFSDALGDRVDELIDSDSGSDDSPGSIDVYSSGHATRLSIVGVDLLGCGSDEPVSFGVGLDVAVAPGDLEAMLREFNDPDSVGDIDLAVEPAGSAAGGEFTRAIVDDPDEFWSAEVIWTDDDVFVTAYVYGTDDDFSVDDVDLDAIQTALEEQLPSLVANAFS